MQLSNIICDFVRFGEIVLYIECKLCTKCKMVCKSYSDIKCFKQYSQCQLHFTLRSIRGNIGKCIFCFVIKSPKQRLETYCFCSVSYYYYYYYYYSLSFFLSFFPWTMNLSTSDLRNYWTYFHETWWSYRYMFLVGPKVFSFVVKGVKVIF